MTIDCCDVTSTYLTLVRAMSALYVTTYRDAVRPTCFHQGWKKLGLKYVFMFVRFLGFFSFLRFFSMKTDVAKHESMTQKHLKSASHGTHTETHTCNMSLIE